MTTPFRANPVPLPTAGSVGLFAGKVYSWMTAMLLLTAATSVFSLRSGVTDWFLHNSGWFMGILMLELVLVGMFTGMRKSLTFAKGLGLVTVYTFLNGMTLSTFLSQYHASSAAVAFLSSSIVFGLATLYGFLGKSLARFGGWLFMGLLGLIGAMLMNLFLQSNTMDFVISAVAVILFTALAGYDAQMIQKVGAGKPTNLDALECALEVYLDFLNLFIHILRLFGVKLGDD